MIARTWPYGTKKRVRVLEVEFSAMRAAVAVEHLDDPGEATVCILSRFEFDQIAPAPMTGDTRTMEFRKGGPTGGYWAILNNCCHDLLNEDGICRTCGSDCRGIGGGA